MMNGQWSWKLAQQALDSSAFMCHGWSLEDEEPGALALLMLHEDCSGYQGREKNCSGREGGCSGVPEWVTLCDGQGDGEANMHCVYRHQARIGDCPRKPGVESEDQQAPNSIHGACPEARPSRPCYPGKRQVLPGNCCPSHTLQRALSRDFPLLE